MLRDHDVHTHTNCFYLCACYVPAFLSCSSYFLLSIASLAFIITVLLPVIITSFCCTWESGAAFGRAAKDIRISLFFLDQPAALLCKHNRFDSLLFSFVGENVLSKIKGSPDWILLHGPMHSNIETRNGIDIHEGGGAYAGLNI